MAEKKIMIPTKNKFALSKVKLIKDGGLDVHYEVTETVGDEIYTNKYHVESTKDIHPDLKKLFERLRPIMARIFNTTSFLTLIDSDDFKANPKQKSIARSFADECSKNIEVRGITLSGKDDNIGVILTGLFQVSNNQKICINSPRLKYNTESFGFEEELEKIITEIEPEVYAFLFEGKKAQLELFGQNTDGSTTVDNYR